MVREFRGQPEKTWLDRLGITLIPAIDRRLIPLTRGRLQLHR
ncbi:MAG: hypothetical protein ACM32E_25680 [Gemmatimonadota bacterium]